MGLAPGSAGQRGAGCVGWRGPKGGPWSSFLDGAMGVLFGFARKADGLGLPGGLISSTRAS